MCRMFRGNGCKGLALDIFLVCALMTIGVVILKKSSYFGSQPEPFGNRASGLTVNAVSGQQQLGQEGAEGSNLVKVFDRNQQQQWQGGSGEPKLTNQQISSNLIEAKIKEIGDARSKACVNQPYNVKDSVTVIIDFNDYQFYSLKSTISSMLNVNNDRIAEIIIVDDGSTLKYIIEECDKYVASLGKRARLIRQTNQRGQLRSRLAAFEVARMEIVVFLDTNVICTRGWLEPLIHLLTTEPNTIAVPHYDSIHDPVSMEYRTTPHNYIALWTWNLLVKMKENYDKSPHAEFQFIVSPTMRGNAWAVQKSFLTKVGLLDENYEDGGGEYLDLSFKVWMCAGGAVKIATCSHVGIIELNTPVRVKTSRNIRHIATTWFGAHANVVLKFHGLTPKSESTLSKWKPIPNANQCRDIDWYSRHVKNETAIPSNEALQFGVLRVHSGRCASVSKNNSHVDLVPCDAEPNSGEAFELTTSGYIHALDGRCLTTTSNAYIVAENCRHNDTHQTWRYSAAFELVNIWSNYCAQHVSDPEHKGQGEHNQIMMAQQCQSDQKGQQHFNKWTFYPL